MFGLYSDLWPLFHYILWDSVTDDRLEARNWAAYVSMNNEFAWKVVESYVPGDTSEYLPLSFPSCI
jgi:trehalose 6-phosphate synthase/phosphatase